MAQQAIEFRREVPLRHDVDVFVAGGGPAGVAAALAAARQGARVYLAEGQFCFGGMGTAAGLPLFCMFTDGVNFLAGGIGREIYDRLFAMPGGVVRSKRGDSSIQYPPEALKVVYDEMVSGAGLEFSLGTHLVGVQSEDGWVRHAFCWGKSGLFAVRAKAFVDATGDGDLCAWAGAPFEKGDAEGLMQPGSLLSFWSPVDWKKAEEAGNGQWRQEHRLPEAIRDGVFSVPEPHMPGLIQSGLHAGVGSFGHLFGIDGTDERSLTRGVIEGRRRFHEYETYFKRYLVGYEDMELVGSGELVGIRETRRILGDYVLNAEDYFRRAVFADEIGRYCYGMDAHPRRLEDASRSVEDFKKLRLKKGESYGIPYRILTPRGLHNVLAAGRCVSTDRSVQSSLRVMPGCFILGQAAGVAAAMTAAGDADIRSLSVPELQGRLAELGAYLPNRA